MITIQDPALFRFHYQLFGNVPCEVGILARTLDEALTVFRETDNCSDILSIIKETNRRIDL